MTGIESDKTAKTGVKPGGRRRAIADAAPAVILPVDPAPVEVSPPDAASSAPIPETAPEPVSAAKDKTMSSFPAFDFSAPFQTAFADLQEKTKAAFEKGTSAFGDYNDFAKSNVEALVESGKILASGLQELTSALVSEGRSGFENLTAEVKELASAKTPTEFLKLQNELAKKHFDEAVATASKHSEALVKLANEAAAPISGRVSAAMEKIKTAA